MKQKEVDSFGTYLLSDYCLPGPEEIKTDAVPALGRVYGPAQLFWTHSPGCVAIIVAGDRRTVVPDVPEERGG